MITDGSYCVGTFSLSLFVVVPCDDTNESEENIGLVGVMGMSISSEESVETDIELIGVLSAESGFRDETGVAGTSDGRTTRAKWLPVRYH